MAGFIYKLQNIVNTSPDSDDTNINIARCILKNIDKIGFVLEENLLNNSEVLIDGKKYKINSDGDSAYINLDNTIQKGESINVSINYFGNINYLLNTGVRCYFYSKNQLNLPNGYPWYPIFDNCNKKNIE